MTSKPTDAELAILNLLWQHGPSTVRAVHERLKNKDVGYTTTLKQLQVMQEKGLVTRDDSNRSHIYAAAIAQDEIQTALLDHLLANAFGGSTSTLFMRALNRKQSQPEELAEIQKLLDGLSEE